MLRAGELPSRYETRAVRLFAVGGDAQPEDVAMAKAAGFDGHVAKPPDAKDIERVLA